MIICDEDMWNPYVMKKSKKLAKVFMELGVTGINIKTV